jgi:hypothetical protein
MKSIEQYIREKLGHSDAPADVDADDLWASIEQELSPADTKPVATPWPWRSLFFALLLLVIGGLGGWLLSNGLTNVGSTIASEQAAEPVAPEQPVLMPESAELQAVGAQVPTSRQATSTADRSPTGQSTTLVPAPVRTGKKAASYSEDALDAPPLGSQKPFTAPAAAPPTSKENLGRTKFASESKNKVVPSSPSGDSPLAQNSQEKTTRTINDTPLATAPAATNKEQGGPETAILTAQKSIEISSLPSLPLLALTTIPIRFSPPTPTPPKFFRSTMNNHFSAGINTGANLLFTTYSASDEDTDEDLNTAVKPAAGSSFGLNFRYQFNKNFALSTGLEYHRTLNTFEHVTSRDTMIEHPSAYNSGLILAKLRRRVTDNLRTRYFTIPLLVHWNQTRGNFQLGVGAGVGLNLRQFANGTTLNANGEFVPFDAATGPATTPKTFLSFQCSPSVAYRLKPDGKLWLEAKANLNYLPFGTDALSGTNRRSILTGFGVGIRYSL